MTTKAPTMTTETPPAADGYGTIQRGERCPKCGKPGRQRERVFGSWRQVVMVHAYAANSIAGCILAEGPFGAPQRPVSRWLT